MLLGVIEGDGVVPDGFGEAWVAQGPGGEQIDWAAEEGLEGLTEIVVAIGITRLPGRRELGDQVDIAGGGIEVLLDCGSEGFETKHPELPAQPLDLASVSLEIEAHGDRVADGRQPGKEGLLRS